MQSSEIKAFRGLYFAELKPHQHWTHGSEYLQFCPAENKGTKGIS